MVDEIYEYIPNLHGNHTLCYFMNNCRILKQKNPSEGSDVTCNNVSSTKKQKQQIRQQPEWLPNHRCLFLWKDSNHKEKQHVEKNCQMCDKNSRGLYKRGSHKKTRSALPFEGARYWLGCSRSTLPCHLSERLHSRGWQTPGNHQRLKKNFEEQASNKTRVHQELCKSRGGRPGLPVLISPMVSLDIKQHWTMLRHWSQFFPSVSTDIWGHEALHHHQDPIFSVHRSVCYGQNLLEMNRWPR